MLLMIQILVKNWNVEQNFEKSGINVLNLEENSNFGQKSNFCLQIENLVKNL